MSLIARSSLTRATFAGFLTDEPEEEDDLTRIDLRDVTWVDAHGLVGIALQIDEADRAGRDIEVILPDRRDVSTYLSRMGLRSYMEDLGFTGRQLPAVNRRDRRRRLAELQRCESENDYLKIANLVFDKIDQRKYYPELAGITFEAIMELGNNVLEHAGCGYGFTAAQTYLAGSPKEYLVFSVGDAGIGLCESLAAHSPDDDHKAIELAIQEGISGTGEEGRGWGLPEVVSSAIQLGGNTMVSSGVATAFVDKQGLRPKKWGSTRSAVGVSDGGVL